MRDAVRGPTRLIASGFLADEADEVVAAFGMRELRRLEDDGWAAVVLGGEAGSSEAGPGGRPA